MSLIGVPATALRKRTTHRLPVKIWQGQISFIFEYAEELEVDTDCYSLWGGSAGARMVAYLGTYGTTPFEGGDWHPDKAGWCTGSPCHCG